MFREGRDVKREKKVDPNSSIEGCITGEEDDRDSIIGVQREEGGGCFRSRS